MHPLLIGTQNEEIINDIIKATNRQTEVKDEQLYALEDFSKSLETFFNAYPPHYRLYYERRKQQYSRLSIEKTRIVTPPTLIKAYYAMFRDNPIRPSKDYASLKARIGTEIFAKDQRLEPYYTAAYALCKLEFVFRNSKVPREYKPARYHLLVVARYLANAEELPRDNANAMEKYCKKIWKTLWSPIDCEILFRESAKLIATAAEGKLDRDYIRTEAFKKKVSEAAKKNAGSVVKL